MNKAKKDTEAAGCRWDNLATPEVALSAQANSANAAWQNEISQ